MKERGKYDPKNKLVALAKLREVDQYPRKYFKAAKKLEIPWKNLANLQTGRLHINKNKVIKCTAILWIRINKLDESAPTAALLTV